jgi:hypothetical protein
MPLSDIAKKPHPATFDSLSVILAKLSNFEHYTETHRLEPALGQPERPLFRPITDARSTTNPMRAPPTIFSMKTVPDPRQPASENVLPRPGFCQDWASLVPWREETNQYRQ